MVLDEVVEVTREGAIPTAAPRWGSSPQLKCTDLDNLLFTPTKKSVLTIGDMEENLSDCTAKLL